MKNIFNINCSSESVDIAMLTVLVTIAMLMLTHGISKTAFFNETPVVKWDVPF